jgi:hypothetical protein
VVVLRATATRSRRSPYQQTQLCLEAVGIDPATGQELGSVGGCGPSAYVLENGRLIAQADTPMTLEGGGSFRVPGDVSDRGEIIRPVWGMVPCDCVVELVLGAGGTRLLDASRGGYVAVVEPGSVTHAIARDRDGTEVARATWQP